MVAGLCHGIRLHEAYHLAMGIPTYYKNRSLLKGEISVLLESGRRLGINIMHCTNCQPISRLQYEGMWVSITSQACLLLFARVLGMAMTLSIEIYCPTRLAVVAVDDDVVTLTLGVPSPTQGRERRTAV